MSISRKVFSELIRDFRFKELFNELGWDHVIKQVPVAVDNETFKLKGVAEKKGFVVFVCRPDSRGKIPPYNIRKKIDNAVAKLHFEHLIIYTDKKHSRQKWQIVIREEGKPVSPRETDYYTHQEPELLFQRLKGLFFTIDEEENIGLVDVKARVSENFKKNAEKVTKKFYSNFKTEHTKFLNFIKGISSKVDKDWYASLMLNRLMFIYFIQKKGFLNNDKNYLGNKLRETREKQGKNRFYSFYRTFLLTLFHKGLGSPDRDSELTELIGNIPYLNGGLFDVHQVEADYNNIQIDDKAFERVFDFFDQYEWHLDTRIEATGKEINPDVIGYIFEKYINDRASMGAYYTKEDITEYISKNCIVPYLFDEVKRKYPKAFKPDGEIWQMLKKSGDKYIYDAVKHGIEHDLPDDIAAGIKEIKKRTGWNRYAPSEYALPTEIWREIVERRRRYDKICQKIKKGEITKIDDFITYNLNIRQFTQDVIKETDDPALIRKMYEAIFKITVLDPTCGSGAFLFAALNILEPLYAACIQRMVSFVNEAPKGKHKYFEDYLAHINSPEHPNRQYFIYKSIILNNLFGVDIMKEAVEIAKLRLFLKLVSTVNVDYTKKNMGMEPLPDIDFNIRFGNTLVGFASEADLKKTIYDKDAVFADKVLSKFQDQADVVSKAYKRFKDSQLIEDKGSGNFSKTKYELRKRLNKLSESLNKYQAHLYGEDADRKPKEYERWKESHQPFHWYAEFYEIIQGNGGFDVIIGNPPYVEYSKVKKHYTLKGLRTEKCGNLYAYVIEKSFELLNKSGLFGMIVPLSLVSTKRMSKLQESFLASQRTIWLSLFDVYPCKLFEGAKQRLTIFLTSLIKSERSIFSTKYNRWKPIERKFLINKLSYYSTNYHKNLCVFPKQQNNLTDSILNKLNKRKVTAYHIKGTKVSFYVHRIPYNYVKSFNFTPYFWNSVDGEKKSEDYKPYYLYDAKFDSIVLAIINSNLFFWWWYTLFEGYHCGRHEIHSFPAGLDEMPEQVLINLNNLSIELMEDVKKNKSRKSCKYKKTGVVEYDEFYPRLSKRIIDQIDYMLANHYNFTEEEIDFLLNYDIKYRMGNELEI